METLIVALLQWFNDVRREAKSELIKLFLSAVALTIVETVIVALQRERYSIPVGLVGFIWILITGFVIFARGGIVVDKLTLLAFLKIEPGKISAKGLGYFFVLELSIVLVFFFLPVYNHWRWLVISPTLIMAVLFLRAFPRTITTIFAVLGILLLLTYAAPLWRIANEQYDEMMKGLSVNTPPNLPQRAQPMAEATKTKRPVATSRPAVPAPAMQVVPTGVTLPPGGMLVGTKNPGAPPVDLVLLLATGEIWTVAAQYVWIGDNLCYRHVSDSGRLARLASLPVTIFYKTDGKGKYNFRPLPPSSPASAPHPSALPTKELSPASPSSANETADYQKLNNLSDNSLPYGIKATGIILRTNEKRTISYQAPDSSLPIKLWTRDPEGQWINYTWPAGRNICSFTNRTDHLVKIYLEGEEELNLSYLH